MTHHALRLRLDSNALQNNWRWLQRTAGVPAGAAVKADGYGLGAREVTRLLARGRLPRLLRFDLGRGRGAWAAARGRRACRAARRRARRCRRGAGQHGAAGAQHAGTGRALEGDRAPDRPCDVMIDTGMNRLGLRTDEIELLDGLEIHTLHSHLACADEDSAMNAVQRDRFAAVAATVDGAALQPRQQRRHLPWPRLCVRPRPARAWRSTAAFRATRRRAISRRSRFPRPKWSSGASIRAGETCGYGATWTADARHRGGDRQHRLCRRLSALLRGQGVGQFRRQGAAADRPRVDGPDRARRERRAGSCAKAIG